MRSVGIVVVLVLTVAGCAAPVVLQNPTTRELVNCTLEAQGVAYDAPGPSVGTDVPWSPPGPPPFQAFDFEQYCAGSLLNAGYVCISGCTTPPR